MQKITLENSKMRIDQYLMEKTEYSRSQIQKMIASGEILLDGKIVKNNYKGKEGQEITIEKKEITENLLPEEIPLAIVYEDNDILVVNKENGMVVHPALGNQEHTLVNALLYHFKELSHRNGILRPGIVHRIDAYTTGLLMVAKNDKAHEILAKQLEEKTTHRKYVALVWGVISHDTGTIDAPIGRDLNDRKKMAVTSINSKKAITHFKVLERYKNATYIELKLETGRTHQIRVHMNYIGYPIVNDPVYGRRKIIDATGQCLHAKELGFLHPTKKTYMEFTCELPAFFLKIQKRLKQE